MKLFIDEVKNLNELNEKLKDNDEISKDYEVAVIVYVFDSENNIENCIKSSKFVILKLYKIRNYKLRRIFIYESNRSCKKNR